jgi:hypothetical protein
MRNTSRLTSFGAMACAFIVAFQVNTYFVRSACVMDGTEPDKVSKSPETNPAGDPARARTRRMVDALKKESVEKSVERMCLASAYDWPGTSAEDVLIVRFPLDSAPGIVDVHRLMSSRRFVKVYQELSTLPKIRATDLIRRELQVSLKKYDRLYEEYVEAVRSGSGAKSGRRLWGAISDNGDVDNPTVLGLRLQVLGLVLLAGNLELKDTAPAVMTVAKRGVEQYKTLQDPTKYSKSFAVSAAADFSLYSRHVLATGMIGTAPLRDDPIVLEYAARLQTRELAPLDAARTPYDNMFERQNEFQNLDLVPVQMRCMGDLSDSDLDQILAAVVPR